MQNQLHLTRRDLLTMINDLHEDIVHLFNCEACSLYFPSEHEMQRVSYLPEEEKLLLPLRISENAPLLGVFLIRKPEIALVEKFLPSVEKLVKLALEKLVLKKTLLYDTNTELFTSESLITSISTKIEQMRENFAELPEFAQSTFIASGSAGVLYFHFPTIEDLAKKHGYLFAEACLQELSLKILENIPHDAILARVHGYDCALLLTEDNCDARSELNDFIYELCHNLNALVFTPSNAQSTKLSINTHAGYILFPQDYDNLVAPRDPRELAFSLLAYARYTAVRAFEQKKTFLPFANLVHEGGNISRLLPHSQLIINLGKNVGLRESMRFSVYGKKSFANEFNSEQNLYKGEISLLEIFDEYTLAEEVLLYDPTCPFSENDILIKLPDDYLQNTQGHGTRQKDMLTQLYKYSDFLTLFTEKRQSISSFTLALLQVESEQGENMSIMPVLAEIIQYVQRSIMMKYNLEPEEENCIFARYSENNILLFIPQTADFTRDIALEAYKNLADELTAHLNRKIAIGITEHPFLHFKSTDALDNCKKALECAKLLEAPHVSYCDSIALTIAADKVATQGLIYEALQMYQSAILADSTNSLALNSLGVTLVSLKRYSEAQTTFLNALELTPDDISILYNLGGISQTLGEMNEARKYYDTCLQSEEYHYFTLLRLGQIAETEKNIPLATEFYNKAIEKDPTHATPYRQLARFILEEDIVAAREYLYSALRYTQYDPASLILLAHIYMEHDKEPNIASALLKPIMTQRQTNIDAWKIYAKALKAQGKEEEALFAENKIKNLANLDS